MIFNVQRHASGGLKAYSGGPRAHHFIFFKVQNFGVMKKAKVAQEGPMTDNNIFLKQRLVKCP